MPRIFIVLVLSLLGAPHVLADTPREAIRKIIDKTHAANDKRDVKGATDYMAPDYYLIRYNGQRVSRSDRVKALTSFFQQVVTFKYQENSNLIAASTKSAQTTILYTIDCRMRMDGRIMRQVSRSREKSWWSWTPAGWKVTHSQVLMSEYRDAGGKWQPLPK